MKSKTIFACVKCGSQFSKWMGQCPECGAWNSLSEEVYTPMKSAAVIDQGGFSGQVNGKVTLLSEVSIAEQPRVSTNLMELDRVLGGGLVEGSVVLIGGDPGIGKSTLLLQTLAHCHADQHALYVTGEESLQQVSLRARRLGLPLSNLHLLAATQVESIIHEAHNMKPRIMVVDSIQTIFTSQLNSASGSVGQVRESAAQLVRYAKQSHTALFLVGHVTKEGMLAGPRVLEHMVDTVLYFEGERDSRFRMIRAVKNRFGAVNELGIFAMTEKGLRQVNNPSAIFLSRGSEAVSGSVITVAWEGSRPLLVEVQALVDQSHLGNPRRVTVGLEQSRLAMLLAVLHKQANVMTYDQDVFVNVVGGVKVTETAADLAQLVAVISSFKNKPLSQDLIVFGEVGLAGEIRPVQNGQARLKEALKHGFKRAIIPKANAPKNSPEGLEVMAVGKLEDVVCRIN